MFLMFNNIWNERVFRTVLKLPLKPLLLFLFSFFFFMPPVMYLMVWPLECFLASIRAQMNVMTKEVKKKNKTKKTQKSKELKTSTILDLLFLSYLSCNFGDRLI